MRTFAAASGLALLPLCASAATASAQAGGQPDPSPGMQVQALGAASAAPLGFGYRFHEVIRGGTGRAPGPPQTYPIVHKLDARSAAARAGLRDGDVLLAVNGRDAREAGVFGERKTGMRYTVRVRRADEEREITFILPAAPAD